LIYLVQLRIACHFFAQQWEPQLWPAWSANSYMKVGPFLNHSGRDRSPLAGVAPVVSNWHV